MRTDTTFDVCSAIIKIAGAWAFDGGERKRQAQWMHVASLVPVSSAGTAELMVKSDRGALHSKLRQQQAHRAGA